jgi:hypothetical protein
MIERETTMTEHQIETYVERAFDRLDAEFMDNRITEAQYEARVLELARWASRQYYVKDIFLAEQA